MNALDAGICRFITTPNPFKKPMTTAPNPHNPPNPLVLHAFGRAIIPDWHYDDLVSENQTQRDRINSLEATSDHQRATLLEFQQAMANLEQLNVTLDEMGQESDWAKFKAVEENVKLKADVLTAQKELSTIKEAYTKTLAANTELDKKLSEAIANLSATELQCNEQTVQIVTLQASRNALLADFGNSKRAVNIEQIL